MENFEFSQRKKIQNLIEKRNYFVEIQEVVTEDGYLLSIFRIKGGKNEPSSKPNNKPPALLIHGLFSSCCEWVLKENGFGYYLADEGFDVWMGNCRGTTLSRGHTNLNCETDRKQYWDFSFHEIGYYDIAACIDHILRETKFSKLFYVGDSQGVTSFLALMSSRIEFNSKIALAIFQPSSGVFSENRKLALAENIFGSFFENVTSIFGHMEMPFIKLMSDNILRRCIDSSSYSYSIFKPILIKYFPMVFTSQNFDEYNFELLMEFFPNTISTKQAIHYLQLLKLPGVFKRFDHGSKENIEKYGSETPPLYDLSQIIIPVAIFFSKNDAYCTIQEVELTASSLGNVVHEQLIDDPFFCHTDFVFSKNVRSLLQIHVLNIMKKYVDGSFGALNENSI